MFKHSRHQHNHHRVSRNVTQPTGCNTVKSTELCNMQRRTLAWLKADSNDQCPALRRLLKCYNSLQNMPIVETFGCDSKEQSTPAAAWQGPLPQLPQYASTLETRDSSNVKRRIGWVYAIIGSQSPSAIYIGWTDCASSKRHSSMCERFWRHCKACDKNSEEGKLHHAMHTHGVNTFIIVGLMRSLKQNPEQIPPRAIPMHKRAEQLWMSHCDSLHSGLNSIRAVEHTSHADNSIQQGWFRDSLELIERQTTQILVSSWNREGSSHTTADLEQYSTRKLISHFDTISRFAKPEDRLLQSLYQVIKSRVPSFLTSEPKEKSEVLN